MVRAKGRSSARVVVFGWIVAAAVIALPILNSCGMRDEAPKRKQGPPPSVTVIRPLPKTIIEWDQYTGRFRAIESVKVRARVSGYLKSIHFEDGDIVDEGDLLFVIDPRPFEAALEKAKGDREDAEALYELAKIQLARNKALLKENAISQDQFDERLTRVKRAKARLDAARGAERAAELDLEFTQVRAPVKGGISYNFVSVGNLISGGNPNSTVLTEIVSLDPIYFYFDVNERTYQKYIRLGSEGKRPSSREHRNPVFAKVAAEDDFSRRGEMNFIDYQVSPRTATVQGRALFLNSDNTLLPGMFARVRVPGTGPYEALLIPGEALMRDQAREFVYVVGENNTAERRTVRTGPRACGLRIIRSGLTREDRVVLKGLQRVRPGSPVKPDEGEFSLRSRECLAEEYPEFTGSKPKKSRTQSSEKDQ